MTNKKQICLKIDNDLYDKLIKKIDGRSITYVLVQLIKKYLGVK